MDDRYPVDWNERRREVYKRDDYTCSNCGKRGGPHGDVELHAHHLIPVSKGGSHDLSNLSTLCAECHKNEHYGELDSNLEELDDNGTPLNHPSSDWSFEKAVQQHQSNPNHQFANKTGSDSGLIKSNSGNSDPDNTENSSNDSSNNNYTSNPTSKEPISHENEPLAPEQPEYVALPSWSKAHPENGSERTNYVPTQTANKQTHQERIAESLSKDQHRSVDGTLEGENTTEAPQKSKGLAPAFIWVVLSIIGIYISISFDHSVIVAVSALAAIFISWEIADKLADDPS